MCIQVLNTSGVPSAIARQLVAVNGSLDTLPDLRLLHERLGRVHHEQTADHICASLPAGWQPGDVTECDELLAQMTQARASLLSSAS